jgi:hypothetical protein
MRIDTNGRDVTDLPGLWDDSDTDVAQLKKDAAELAKLAKEMMDHIGETERDLPSWLEFNRYASVAIAKVQRHLHG